MVDRQVFTQHHFTASYCCCCSGVFNALDVVVPVLLHSLQYFLTGSSGLTTFPEFVAVGMMDGVQFGYYDSNIQGIVVKQAWTEQFYRDHPGELEMITERALDNQQGFKATILDLKKLFNQTGGWGSGELNGGRRLTDVTDNE
ncbi:unnamed protein product [Arctogadus glacialis]